MRTLSRLTQYGCLPLDLILQEDRTSAKIEHRFDTDRLSIGRDVLVDPNPKYLAES